MIEHKDLDFIESKYLRAAIKRSGLTHADVARNLGWNQRGRPSGSRVQKVCGYQNLNKKVKYETAIAIIEACHYDPVDYGL